MNYKPYRVSTKDLERKVKELNIIRGFETKPMKWCKETNKMISIPKVYYIGKAYGGYRLEQIVNLGGGSKDITKRTTKKEIYEMINMIITGYELACKDNFL